MLSSTKRRFCRRAFVAARAVVAEALEDRRFFAVHAIPATYLSNESGAGLVGSYVNTSLRGYAAQTDWRSTQAIAGTRTDATVNFATNGWGTRSTVGLTGGTDSDWNEFSVQWDGFVNVVAPNTRLYTRSDDGSRLWIDLNNDGSFNTSGPEVVDNGWGTGHGATTSPSSPALAPGTYRIRVQYEEGGGDNSMVLGWSDAARSAGLVDPATIVSENGNLISGEINTVSLALTAGDVLEILPDNASDGGIRYAPAVELLTPQGAVLSSSFDGRSYRVTTPATGSYTGRITGAFAQRAYLGDYAVSFRTTPFAGTTESESNNTTATADPLATPWAFKGGLSITSDVDIYSFPASAGQTVAVKFANLSDRNPAVRILNPVGAQVAAGSDGNGLVYTFPSAGTYYLSVALGSGTPLGDYVGGLNFTTLPVTAETGTTDAFDNAAPIASPDLHVIPASNLSTGTVPGLTASFVNTSLRARATQDDWRTSQTISGARVDSAVSFVSSHGSRSSVGITGGTDANWDNFSVQWDGLVTITTPNTRLYTRSDDGSRLWIDVNKDNVFATGGNELVKNGWGAGQGATTSAASVPLAVGTYRIRVQYEEGNGGNEVHLLWDDPSRSAGVVQARTTAAAGVLSGVNDVDVFAVDLAPGAGYDFRLQSSAGALFDEDRFLAVTNEFGQILAYSYDGDVHVDERQARGGRHLLVVRAANPAGAGGYVLTGNGTGMFPTQRDVPLYYFDFTASGSYFGYTAAPFQNPAAQPLIMGVFDSTLGMNDIDLTTVQPAAGVERVNVAIGDVPNPPWGGLGGGGRGNRRPSGDAINDVSGESGWNSLDDAAWAFNVSRHEGGHATGFFPHLRHAIDMMSYDNQLSGITPGETFPFGDNPLPDREIFRARDYLDWMTQAGRYAFEVEGNDSRPLAQDVMPLINEMSGDADPRNDKAVVLAAIRTPGDQDYYRVTATAGQRFSFDVEAGEFQVPLAAEMVVTDANGATLAQSSFSSVDGDSGVQSRDPFLTYTFAAAGIYYVRVTSASNTSGQYRLKVAPDRAWDKSGPRILAMTPNGGQSLDATRQIVFWLDKAIDHPASFTNAVTVRHSNGTVITGFTRYDASDQTLVWSANSSLLTGTYTVTVASGGASGLRDLYGNALDGETGGVLSFPNVSGNGAPGGDFVSTFTITAADTSAAPINSFTYDRHAYNFGRFTLRFGDEIDYAPFITQTAPQTLTLRQAGPDNAFATADDVILPYQVAVNKVDAVGSPHVFIYTNGVPEPGNYRIEGTLRDAAGNTVNVSRTVVVPGSVIPSSFLQVPNQSINGLTGSYVNTSLRNRSTIDDWRSTAGVTISGTRVDGSINFTSDGWGQRSTVGLTSGTDGNWENFSTQWDGWVTIPQNGTRVFTRSDDGSRFWIDANNDGSFANTAAEFVNNGWGTGQGATLSSPSAPLAAGTYRIRIQYEEGNGGNDMELIWDYEGGEAASGSPIRMTNVAEVLPTPGSVLFTSINKVDVTFSGPLNTATLTTNNFRLRYSPTQSFFDGDDTFVADADGVIAWDATRNRATLAPLSRLQNGFYLLEMNGGPGGLADEYGRALDGEFLNASIPAGSTAFWNSSPSGDGLPGGDARVFFSINEFNATGNDTVYLRRNGNNVEVFHADTPTGQPVQTYSLATLQQFTAQTGPGNDRVIIDFRSGNPLPAGGLTFNGGDGTSDTLTVIGDATLSALLAPTAAGAGSVTAGGRTVQFTNVDQNTLSGFATATLRTPNSADNLTLTSPAPGETRITGNSAALNLDPITVTNVGTLVLDTTANDVTDTFTLTASAGASLIRILAGVGNNTISAAPGSSLNLSIGGNTTTSLTGGLLASLALTDTARTTIAAATAVLRTGALSLADDALLDLGSGDVVVDYTLASPYPDIRPWLRNGLLGSGPRIVSQATAGAAVGAVDNAMIRQSTWNGLPLTTTGDFRQLILVQTVTGDNDLDGQVTAADHANIVANMGRTGVTYFQGDMNFDNAVTADDFAIVTAAVAAAPAAPPSQLLTPTPQPSASTPPAEPLATPTPEPLKPRDLRPPQKPLPARPLKPLPFSAVKITRAPLLSARPPGTSEDDLLALPRPLL